VLATAGASLEDIVRATYYVTRPADAEPVLQVCGEVLAEIRPAAAILIVSALLKPEMKVEIEVTAMKRGA
jgi:enamine deaminase RidA (YjgF/YER057c/UK114 family)